MNNQRNRNPSMLQERIEPAWIDAFEALLRRCALNAGTDLRAFAADFLCRTGANEVAGRYTPGRFDLPLRGCTVALEDEVVVNVGKVVA